MKALGVLFGSLFGLIGACAALEFLHVAVTRDVAFEQARRLARGRGIINLGAGPHRTYQAQIIAEAAEVLANIDIGLNGMPRFMQLDLERDPLPFTDKQFGCAFASHVLEHLDNWQFALDEACRVADYVVVVLPHPASLVGWVIPEHRQHFSTLDIDAISSAYPSAAIFY